MTEQIPVIDLAAYYSDGPQAPHVQRTIEAIHEAASTWGFFILTGTTVSSQTQSSLLSTSQAFFNLAPNVKSSLDVRNGGVAWRGYMPIGGEHTHGQVDWKEGLYVGPEHENDHPLVGLPLHGKNLFPDQVLPDMRPKVLKYVDEVTNLGKDLTDIFSLGLSLGKEELRKRLLEPEPVVLFRCFKYAAIDNSSEDKLEKSKEEGFGIGEHTGNPAQRQEIRTENVLINNLDFGFLTILKVDSLGLEVS